MSGAWRDETGTVYEDESYRFAVAYGPEKDAEVRAVLEDTRVRFQQLALYTERPNVAVEII